MITTTLDPISLNDVTDLENAPCVVEGGRRQRAENLLRVGSQPPGIPGDTGARLGRHFRSEEDL